MDPESIVREIIEECGDCDVCRDLMDGVCFFFPKLYEIWDRENFEGIKATPSELRDLVEYCHFCAICPCEPVRAKIIKAKTAFIERDGIPWTVRLLEDVELMWRILRNVPANRLLSNRIFSSTCKKIFGIHRERQMLAFSEESFDMWAKRKGLTEPIKIKDCRKVAYFVGCTGRFLFPQVPKSFVEIMNRLEIPVYFFDQHCCGMPALLEGDKKRVFSWVGSQIKQLFEMVVDGYDIVCSCPTCSFMLRKVIPAGINYKPLRKMFSAKDDRILASLKDSLDRQEEGESISLHGKFYETALVDEDYFASVDPVERFVVASHTFDAGEYLLKILDERKNVCVKSSDKHRGYIYFPPCHQREQKGEGHYLELFRRLGIDGISVFRDSFSCCGLGGIRGFSQHYYEKSVEIGKRLIEKIDRMEPLGIVTECLSCRVQFEELADYVVVHPLEVINKAMD